MKGIIILINNEWYFIGKNPYGNNVEENNNGFRRVEISGGWAYEEQTLIDSLKICRAKTENDLIRTQSKNSRHATYPPQQ